MRENRERLQEMYSAENKPPLLGHVEKEEIDPEQPTSTQQQRSVLLTEPEAQIDEVWREQDKWEQLEQRMSAEKNKQPEDKEISDLDLEAEMEKETRGVQESTTGQTTNEADSTQRDSAGDEVPDSQTRDDENNQ